MSVKSFDLALEQKVKQNKKVLAKCLINSVILIPLP
jgi:hypothetical protein